MGELLNEMGDENKQIKVFIDPNEIKECEPKTKEELQKELEEKIKTFVDWKHKRDVFGY